MQNFNYHTHTYRCKHADNNMSDEDYVLEFIKKGFKKIAFTDHAPEKEIIDTRKRMRMDYEEVYDYLESIKYLKEKYKNVIEIESGFEIEYLPGQEDNINELKGLVDKMVLGQHFIYGEHHGLKIFRYQKFNEEDLLKYANYIKKAIELNIPDIIVHPDIYMLSSDTFGNVERKVAEIICESASKYNIPLEINLTEASMYLSKLKDRIDYPCKEFWEVVSNYDIRVLYGVDAHYKEQIDNYEDSIDLVNKVIGEETIKKLKFIKNAGEL